MHEPKARNLAWGMPLSEVSRAFSGFRSQCMDYVLLTEELSGSVCGRRGG